VTRFITIDKHLKVSIKNVISDSAVCIPTIAPPDRELVYVNRVIAPQMADDLSDVLIEEE
jgi:hypothetical protein